MSKFIIVANWKMYLNFKESLALAKKIAENTRIQEYKNKAEIIICPSFTAMEGVGKSPKNGKIKVGLGAQDVFWENKGAYTGEVSPLMLKELGCRYVIISHSERNSYLKETAEMVNRKIRAALAESLVPIVCVGETAEEKKQKKGKVAIRKQIEASFRKIRVKGKERIFVAYEPVWAIGSGRTVVPGEAEDMSEFIREVLAKIYSPKVVAKNFHVLYGGSVNSSNIGGFVSQRGIDGVLVGGASANFKEFARIIRTVQN